MQNNNFENVLYANEKKNIGLYLTKGELVEGILLDIQKSHIALRVNDKVIYIAINQIQAISKNTKDLLTAKEITPYLVRNDLTDVLIALRYHWVSLNMFGIPPLFGVLSSIFEDHIILINNKELLYAPISHITDVSSEISEIDYNFLNKKEQLTIQRMYRLGLSKGSFEEREESLFVDSDRTILADDGIIADVINPIKNRQVDKNTFTSQLTKKFNSLLSEQDVETVSIGIPDEITETINVAAIEDHTFSLQVEEEQESISADIAIVEVGILESEENISVIDGIYMEENEIIDKDTLEKKIISPQSDEKLEIFSDELESQATAKEEEEKEEEKENTVYTNEYLPPLENRSTGKGKEVLLTAWSTMNSDQSTVALPMKNEKNKNTRLNEQKSPPKQLNVEPDRQLKLDVSDKVSETFEKKKPLVNATVMSKEEVNKMLEQQYFALMNYAAVQISNAINSKQEDNKLYFRPRVHGSSEKNRRREMNNEYTVYDSKHDTAALEKQFISLMRHATTMYRKLRR